MSESEELRRFLFDLNLGDTAGQDLQLRVDALEERLNRIVQRATLKDIPVLQSILNLSTDTDELEVLGKALLRVSELLPELEELRKRQNVIDTVQEHPEWLAATFADFSSDIDEFIDRHQSENPPE